MRTPRLLLLSFAICGSLAAGCAEDNPQSPAKPGSDEGAEAPKPKAAVPQDVVLSKEVEVEPGRTVTVQRLADEGVVLTEVGDLDESGKGPGSDAPLHEVVPLLGARSAERAAQAADYRADRLQPPPDSSTPIVVEPSGEARGQKAAPRSTDGPRTGTVSSGADKYLLLRCNDLAATFCNPWVTTSANTAWEFGGFYRALAYNDGTSPATFTISTWNGSSVVMLASLNVAPHQWAQMQYLPAGPGWAMASISGASGTPVGISSLLGSIGPRAQENGMWCWLAAAQMAMSSIINPPEQCTLANTHFQFSNCCSTPTPALCGGDGTHGAGEAMQPLKENKFSFNKYDNLGTNAELLAQGLQGGPVILHETTTVGHYVVVSDYTERFEGGAWVPYVLVVDPAPIQVYSQEAHITWMRISDLTSSGSYTFGLSDIRNANRSNLSAAITRVAWANGSAKMYFDAPGATTFQYQIYDGGGSTTGALWESGSVPYADAWDITGTSRSFSVGAWLWYDVKVRAGKNGSYGSWVSSRSVSLKPIASIDSLTSSGGLVTANVHAEAAPPETFFRYRFMNSSGANTWRSSLAPGSATRFASSATISVPFAPNTVARFQVQACSNNGCGGWADQSVNTH